MVVVVVVAADNGGWWWMVEVATRKAEGKAEGKAHAINLINLMLLTNIIAGSKLARRQVVQQRDDD
jgi:hypothetical protein